MFFKALLLGRPEPESTPHPQAPHHLHIATAPPLKPTYTQSKKVFVSDSHQDKEG